MIQHYKGELGEFDYDDTEFTLKPLGTSFLSYTKKFREILKYCGNETDGKNICIPQGITACIHMFSSNNILKSAPEIPYGVCYADFMFSECSALTDAAIQLPITLISAKNMFNGCCNLVQTPVELPFELDYATSMFSNCKSLVHINFRKIPMYLRCMEYMFANCVNLVETPKMIINLYNYNSRRVNMFMNCRKLQKINIDFSFILDRIRKPRPHRRNAPPEDYYTNLKFMFLYCDSLKKPLVPKNKYGLKFICFYKYIGVYDVTNSYDIKTNPILPLEILPVDYNLFHVHYYDTVEKFFSKSLEKE